MNNDVYVMVCKHDKLDNISWLDSEAQNPNLDYRYPLQRHTARINANRLDNRPDKQNEDNVVDDKENGCSKIAPRVDIEYEEDHDSEIYEDDNASDDY